MSCLGFSNSYLDKTVVKAPDSLTRDMRNTYFMKSMKGCFGKSNLICIETSEKEITEDC